MARFDKRVLSWQTARYPSRGWRGVVAAVSAGGDCQVVRAHGIFKFDGRNRAKTVKFTPA